MTFAEFVCEAAVRLGLNDYEVARRCKVSVNTVQRWKAGKAVPYPLMADAVREELEK